MYFLRNFSFTELVNYLLYHYFINYHYWKFIYSKYDNILWNFDNDPYIEWYYNSDNISNKNLDLSDDENIDINYDSDEFSHCLIPYNINNYGNF